MDLEKVYQYFQILLHARGYPNLKAIEDEAMAELAKIADMLTRAKAPPQTAKPVATGKAKED